MQSRSRAALIALLTLWFGLIISQPSPAQTLKDRHGKPLKIGLQLYSVRADCDKDLPGVLKAVAKMGYTGVEFAGYHGYTAEHLRSMLAEDGLACYGTHVDLNAITGENLDKTAAFCKALGCPLVVVPWLPDDRRSTRTEILATAKLFDDAAARLKRDGILLGWHNENYEWHEVDGETIWQTFWENASPGVKMQFDIGNAMDAGVQAAPYLSKYPGKVVSLHVKDHSATNPTALLGEGDEHWSEVIPLIKHRLSPRWYIIEQESYNQPPLVCVEQCLRNFEKLWNQYP